ncbi:MAG: autotransporter outer membrane beta-barrel domain-containing protein [Pseudomonadota bacterium]
MTFGIGPMTARVTALGPMASSGTTTSRIPRMTPKKVAPRPDVAAKPSPTTPGTTPDTTPGPTPGSQSRTTAPRRNSGLRSQGLVWLLAILVSVVFWSASSPAWSLQVDCSGEVSYGYGEEKLQRDNVVIYSTNGQPNGCDHNITTDIFFQQTFSGTRSNNHVSDQTSVATSMLVRMSGGNSGYELNQFAIMVAKADRSGWDTITLSNASCQKSDGTFATLTLSPNRKAVLVEMERIEDPARIPLLALSDFYQPSADDVTCALSITTDTGATLTDVTLRRTDLYFLQGSYPVVRGQHIFEGGIWSSSSSATSTPPSVEDPDPSYLIREFLATRSKHMLAASPGTDRAHARLRESCMHREEQEGLSTNSDQATIVEQERACPEEPGTGAGLTGSSSVGGSLRGASPGNHTASAAVTPQQRGADQAGPQTGGLARALNLTGEGTGDRGTVTFATSLRQMREAAVAQAKAKQGGAAYAGSSSAQALAQRPFGWDLWVEGKYLYYETERPDGDYDGNFGLLSGGVDYVFSPSLLAGVMLQFDKLDMAVGSNGATVDGIGWMAGPYFSARVTNKVFLDARALWGTSSNDINPLGTYTDQFGTDRQLYAAKLSGTWTAANGFSVTPDTELAYFREHQTSYVDSNGDVIDSQSFHIGRLTFGGKIERTWAYSADEVVRPYIGLHGIWDFAKSDQTTISGNTISTKDIYGRVEVGLTASRSDGTSLQFGVTYEGIGDTAYDSIEAKTRLTFPLQR